MTENGWSTAAKRWEPLPAADAPHPVELEQTKLPTDPCDPIHCDTCNMWLNGLEQFRDHLRGHKHRRKSRAARALRPEQAMFTITMLLVAKWKEEQKAHRRRVLTRALAIWACPRWLRAIQMLNVLKNSRGADGSSLEE